MNAEPLISIIITNYNYARFLPAAIDSALQQTYRAVEVIVVDDGSTDHSCNIIHSYGDRIRPVLKENGGQASAFNAGLTHRHGAFVIFLDADDMLLPQTAQRVVEAFRANANAVKVQYRMAVVDALGAPTGKVKPAAHLPLASGDLRRQVLSFPFDLTWMATSGNAFAAAVLRRIFPLPEADFPILADYYLSHLTPLFGPVVFLDEIGAYYRLHCANHHEQREVALDLAQIRRTILYTQRTFVYIRRFAQQLGLDIVEDNEDELSVSSIANRLVSWRFDPAAHPVTDDSRWRLLLLGMRASYRRFDVPLVMRLLFLSWFLAMAMAPKPLAYWLAERFFFPEKRVQFNRLLRVLHSSR